MARREDLPVHSYLVVAPAPRNQALIFKVQAHGPRRYLQTGGLLIVSGEEIRNAQCVSVGGASHGNTETT
jgi:hypothetical protein